MDSTASNTSLTQPGLALNPSSTAHSNIVPTPSTTPLTANGLSIMVSCSPRVSFVKHFSSYRISYDRVGNSALYDGSYVCPNWLDTIIWVGGAAQI
jgi:hypothetical protein